MNSAKRESYKALATEITNAANNVVIEKHLNTSERVLKRITEGIYRQPSSALRELISNAYDADATLVEIQTDPPRFDRIIVRDNGIGLSIEALSYMIQNIGGSSKRTSEGSKIHVCNANDKTRSPGGRKLIGKIGIGLFSISQLTKEFQIITKMKGDNHRTIADVILYTYSEDEEFASDEKFGTGSVKIWKVPAVDTNNQGTEVILRNLLTKTKEDLRSKKMWLECIPDNEALDNITTPRKPPDFHIGCVFEDPSDTIKREPQLPWKYSDKTEDRFKLFIKNIYNLRGTTSKNPSIDENLDNYLKMLWTLSLSAPIDYMDGHPFELYKTNGLRYFQFGNSRKGQASEIILKKDESIRAKLDLISPERGSSKNFKVIIDGVQLFRPIIFTNLPKTLEAVPYTLLFFGKDKPDLSSIPKEIRGGDLEFEGYMLWNHIVVPKEHVGVLIRINDSSGALFDNSFMDYQVSEQTRMNQVIAEIYVTKGLDEALNIDRESFNYSHPHYQYLTNWVHSAFRQFTNKHKAIASVSRNKLNIEKSNHDLNEIEKEVDKNIRKILPDQDSLIPVVEFVENEHDAIEKRKKGIIAFQKADVFESQEQKKNSKNTKVKKSEDEKFKAQIKAVAQVLEAYGVFDNMTYEKQQNLLRAIVDIFSH